MRADVQTMFKKLLARKLRQLVLQTGKRCDGRMTDEVRPISIEVALLPSAHGSALFTRYLLILLLSNNNNNLKCCF